jgi:hypothetical protein
MKRKLLKLGLLFVLICSFNLLAQEEVQPGETESRVPELSEFHKVIYPIWHKAYPQKDYAALRNYAQEVRSYAEKLYQAELPGILRDKKIKWKEGLAELNKAVDDYLAAAAGDDDQVLLNAAEVLHSKFEMMVRIIRPVLKEIDEFHKVLYVIYHKYLPNKKYDGIESLSEDLKAKAEAITRVELPKRLETRTEKFTVAANKLYKASVQLAQECQSGDSASIEEAVHKLHAAYKHLEKIFE